MKVIIIKMKGESRFVAKYRYLLPFYRYMKDNPDTRKIRIFSDIDSIKKATQELLADKADNIVTEYSLVEDSCRIT